MDGDFDGPSCLVSNYGSESVLSQGHDLYPSAASQYPVAGPFSHELSISLPRYCLGILWGYALRGLLGSFQAVCREVW